MRNSDKEIKYEALSVRAKALGMNWVFNSIEGLEFAVSFFEKEAEKNNNHIFNYGRKCIKCGIDQRTLMMANNDYCGHSLKNSCKELSFLKEKYGIDPNRRRDRCLHQAERTKSSLRTKRFRKIRKEIAIRPGIFAEESR